MCNLKLDENKVKKEAIVFYIVLDDLLSDDDWITEGEKHQTLIFLMSLIVQHDKDESDEE